MTILSQRDLFPLIAGAIRALWEEKHGWIQRDEIVDELLRNSEVRQRLLDASLPPERDQRWYVGNAIDWFSQKFTVGQSEYVGSFQRSKIDDKWAYKPLADPLPPEEVKTYTKFEELGRGGFGVVYRGALVVNGHIRESVAIKTYMGAFDEDEYNLLRDLHHPHIIRVLDRYDDRDLRGNAYTCMVLEYANGGSLGDRIRMAPHGLASKDVWKTVAHVAMALDYLHSREPRVLHRDVKPENILFCNGVATLSDVGIAKLVDTTTVTHSGTQTYAYAAPEMLPLVPGTKPVVSPKVDVYALGLTAFVALTGNLPWGRHDPITTMWHHHNSPLPSHPNINDEAAQLLLRMTAKDYQDRCHAAQVVEHAQSLAEA